jgi:prepilin-type N-terminal cleavage/methylation domain-containing protein
VTRGYSLIELLVAFSILVIIVGAAVPLAHTSIDRSRASGAARYVAGRMAVARLEAVKRSAFVAIRFVNRSDGYTLRTYVDGNRNGVLTREIAQGIDRPISLEEALDHHFPGVTFGIHPTVTSLDPGETFDTSDPIQIGRSSLLSFNPNGSVTAGTVFIRGTRANQFAVRVLGTTGRTRILAFNFQDGKWRTL